MQKLENGAELAIGALAERTGCSVPTIRYYEEIGLIPPAKRRPSGHRVYQADSEELLTFIRHCRDFGFPIEQVRELVSLSKSQERDCFETLKIAQAHLAAVRVKMAELRTLERSLTRFARSCSEMCAGGPAAQCSILKDMVTPPQAASSSCCG
ncbi:MerR family transcriptional regulator [Piscinibacter koreensis]|uniref:Helix-turn-helix domain-containing protein n=1 Tax=Piscinibacter koreensis TaxID=2742824 RepID=A0A7Y6NT82_9BURK|nr:helix-turn-helix domain-containing protein [Schlegelella koreensis]NUZ08890.1 helix-turn-helix domain-containing protein [Schlegelella koreensis]